MMFHIVFLFILKAMIFPRLRHLHNRKLRQLALGVLGGKLPLEGVDDESPLPKDHEDDDDVENESGNESEGTQPEEVR